MWQRKLITIIALLACLTLGRFSCDAIAHKQRQDRLADCSRSILAQTGKLDAKVHAELKEAFATALATKDPSPIAIDTLRNRCEAVLADQELFPREAQHIIRLLKDFPIWQDEVHALKYMGQR